MKRAPFLQPNARFSFLPTAILGATFAATLSGCPGGADLEHPEKYFAGSPGMTTGGTGGTGGTSGGTAGTGMGGMAATDVPLPTVDGCDIPAVLSRGCALSGCHKAGAIKPAAGLLLAADNGFVGRVKDKPATHGDIYCGLELCVPTPAECTAPGVGQLLVDSTDYTKSWIIQKMNDPLGCGEAMPVSVSSWTGADQSCIENLVKAIADLP
jgi:hypothetical protein